MPLPPRSRSLTAGAALAVAGLALAALPAVGSAQAAKREVKYTEGDPTGQNRENARLVLASFLKKTKNMPPMKYVELAIVRKIPRDPRQPASDANKVLAQKNIFGADLGFAAVAW